MFLKLNNNIFFNIKWMKRIIIMNIYIILYIKGDDINKVCTKCEKLNENNIQFCKAIGISLYSICKTHTTWLEMDQLAEENMNKLINNDKNDINQSTNSLCFNSIKNIECKKIFSGCELHEPIYFCQKHCKNLIDSSTCPNMIINNICLSREDLIHSKYKNNTNKISYITNDNKCFNLNYTGPSKIEWIIGFIISVVFSFLASLGINFQKKALKENQLIFEKMKETKNKNKIKIKIKSKNKKLDKINEINQSNDTNNNYTTNNEAKEKNAQSNNSNNDKDIVQHDEELLPIPAYKLPLWVIGFVLILTGSILDFVAFGLAPQSLLAPLAALTLVWNMLLAPCFNKEKLYKKDIAATLIIFSGATLAVAFASHTTPTYTLEKLKALYNDTFTVIYFIIISSIIILHFIIIQFVERLIIVSSSCTIEEPMEENSIKEPIDLSSNISSVEDNSISNPLSQHPKVILSKKATFEPAPEPLQSPVRFGSISFWFQVRLVAYSGFAGMMGGQSVLFAKSIAELIKAAFHSDDCLKHYETYMLLIALLICLLTQVHFLNEGLVRYDALSVVPIYQAYWIISGVLGGVIYFQEIHSFTKLQSGMFILGILTTISGVILLAQRKTVEIKPGSINNNNKHNLNRLSSFPAPLNRKRSGLEQIQQISYATGNVGGIMSMA